jgi:hypothetical protein
MNCFTQGSFKKSCRTCTIDLQWNFFAVRTIGVAQWATTAITNRGQNFFDRALARGTKPGSDAPTRNATRRKKQVEQRLAQYRSGARNLREHRSPMRSRRDFLAGFFGALTAPYEKDNSI